MPWEEFHQHPMEHHEKDEDLDQQCPQHGKKILMQNSCGSGQDKAVRHKQSHVWEVVRLLHAWSQTKDENDQKAE